MKKIFVAAFLIANVLQGIFLAGNAYAAISESNNITFSGDAVAYLRDIGVGNLADEDGASTPRADALKQVLYGIMTENNTVELTRTNANREDVATAVLALIQGQRSYSQFAFSIDKSFFTTFPDRKIIRNLDQHFRVANAGIAFNPEKQNLGLLGKNKMCIIDKSQNKTLSDAFSKLSVADAPVGLMPYGNGQMIAVNMFGETVATFNENAAAIASNPVVNANAGAKVERPKTRYTVRLEQKFADMIGDNTPIFVAFDTKNCQPNGLAEKIEAWSRCATCRYFLQVNKIFFSVADVMYSFLSIHLLAILTLVLGLRFLYVFGKAHYTNMGSVNYKEIFFNFTRFKIVKIVIFLGLLWVPPSIIVKWAVEPVVLMGVTLSKEILSAGGAVKNKKMCNEGALMKDMLEDTNQKKIEFLSDENVLLPRTEKIIDGGSFYDADGQLKNYKTEKNEIVGGYTSSILCNVYEVRDYISKHLIVGQVLANFALKEIFMPSPNTTGGILQSVLTSPLFIVITFLALAPNGLFGGFAFIMAIVGGLTGLWSRTLSLLNLFLFGGFVFVSMILFNFILFLKFLDLVINLAVVIMKIPLYLIVWIFTDGDKIDLSFGNFFEEIKKNAISIASISFIVVFMMTFMEHVYYSLLGIPVGAIDRAFELGRESLITQPIVEAMRNGSSSLQFAFLDMLLIILTFWYIAKNMEELLGKVGGALPAEGFVTRQKKLVSSIYDKFVSAKVNKLNKDAKSKISEKVADKIVK